MKIRIAAFKDARYGSVCFFQFDAELHGSGMVRVTDWTEVELPDRNPEDLAAVEAVAKAKQIERLAAELAKLQGIES
jgi:hypothetical protein